MKLRLILLAFSAALSACSGRYMGIDRAILDPSNQAWFDRAKIGDKQAQFELGMRYARGEGVERDCDIARKLLRQAATRTGGTIWVYSPPVTKGGSGRVIPIDQGPVQPGLKTAEQALMELDVSGHCPTT